MRKISKSRADDDVISSTNGSVDNNDANDAIDDHADAVRQADPDHPDEKEPASESTENVELNEDVSTSTTKETPKKGKAKKTKKRKSEKNTADQEYEVEKIVDSKKIKGKLHYLIRWKGYSADSDTWEPENTLSCAELINKYNDEKENSKNKVSKAEKKNNKRKAKKETKVPAKRAKNSWDGSNADENAEYEVERILEVRHKKNGKRDFFIHWKGWSSKFDSWEPENNLNCPELIKKFMDKDPSSGRRLSKRRGQRQRVRYDNAE
ncbi:heterochromatin protein 1 isoform X2 [Helicoverpa armigera]|uniref:heterochromatin protein 1 isoform X2 n=1 Tax=Helicoverpa armigera TaxID=29058 RepID=UPI000B37E8FB|nr:heterochromatin protein 1 isoform X2 [Helicoverpa armigera]